MACLFYSFDSHEPMDLKRQLLSLIKLFEEKCLFSTAKWWRFARTSNSRLCEFAEYSKLLPTDLLYLDIDIYQRYPRCCSFRLSFRKSEFGTHASANAIWKTSIWGCLSKYRGGVGVWLQLFVSLLVELREVDGRKLDCGSLVVYQRICSTLLLSTTQRGWTRGPSSSREAGRGGDSIPLFKGHHSGCIQPLHPREREKHLRHSRSPSPLRFCSPRVHISSFRFSSDCLVSGALGSICCRS